MFSPATRAWFAQAFDAPTPAQTLGWPAIASGEHTLIQAPTGSGKTLAAFLYGIDRLTEEGAGRGLRLLYVSPLKALNYDIERNLRGPLAGLNSDLRIAVRTGDTPQRERAQMLREHPDVLITTPESLFLLLTSNAREMLRSVRTLILDEVHAVAGTKRGAHLALSCERLDRLIGTPVQRVALSATQRPLEEIGRFVSGARPIRLVDAGTAKELDLQVVVPVEDMREPGAGTDLAGLPDDERRGTRHVDLAVDLPGGAAARPRAPLDDRLRQQPAPRRAARAAAERAGGGRDRARASRLDRARAARRDRGAAEARRDPVPRRDVVARARDRHGRRRPRDPGRVAEVGRARAAAHRARRAHARRGLEGADLPEVPRRPARGGGDRGEDAGGRDRGDGHPAQPARRALPADRRRLRRERDHASTSCTSSCAAPIRSPTSRARSSRTCSTCSRAATRRTSSPSCGRASSGTARRA